MTTAFLFLGILQLHKRQSGLWYTLKDQAMEDSIYLGRIDPKSHI